MDDRAWQGGAAVAPVQGRFPALDIARGFALLAMASYHFTFDLALFGLIPPEVPVTGFFFWYARSIASTFLFLSGVGLVLGHGRGIRWDRWGWRFAMVAGAALLISGATFVAMPGAFIFWGILHMIALGSVVGLVFVRGPGWVAALAGVAVLAVWWTVRAPLFDAWPFWWLGLAVTPPFAVDYVPVFPWLAPVLFGVAAGKWAGQAGLWDRLGALPPPGPVARALAWPGRHSLLVYLVHQPVLVGGLWLGLWVAGRV